MKALEKRTFTCFQNFLVCVALHMLMPLLPLLLEWWFAGSAEAKSVSLTAALYSIAIGLSSRYTVLFGIGFLLGVILSAEFGYLSTNPVMSLKNAYTFSYAAIAFMFGAHIIERYIRHMSKMEEFFEFLKEK